MTEKDPHPSNQLPLRANSPPQLDEEAVQSCCDWLSFHRLWGELSQEAIEALARSLQAIAVAANTEIYRQEQEPVGIYLLKWGSVEIYRQSPVGKTHINYCNAGELFGYVPVLEGGASATYGTGASALAKSEIWFLSKGDFERLSRTYPEISTAINRLLARDLANFARRLAAEQARVQGLQPYVRPVPVSESIIGSSKASEKLRQQALQAAGATTAAGKLKPVIFQGPAGSGKTFLAGFIHAHSGLKNRPFAEIDCSQLLRDRAGAVQADVLFGGEGKGPGIIELLERGTLLVDNAHLLPRPDWERLIHYLKTGTLPSTGNEGGGRPPSSWVRLILASPQKISLPEVEAHQIKLFSLPQRKGDIPEFAAYFLARFCREKGRPLLALDQANLRRLIGYDYPGNLAELAGILKRAVAMTAAGQAAISEQVLWSVESQKNAFRIDLLNEVPWLRRFLLSRWWPEGFWPLVMAIFIPVTLWGFIGPQTREDNMILNFFWAWWWPFYLLLFPFAGRLWCSVCPFMIVGEWFRNLSVWIWPRQLLPWPSQWLNRWGAWILFAGFVAIYLWEKLWDLPHTPYLSAWLLAIIAAGAVIGSVIYERRLWCRYLCPIGGMNGMFAKLAMVELRATQQVCGSQCTTFGCYRGSEATPVHFADALPTEGQATGGCPLYSHPAQLKDNRDCVLCMTCLKACPHRSVQLNLRFPAADLWRDHGGFGAEVALMLLLLGGVFLHCSDRILSWLGWGDLLVDSEHLAIAMPIVALLLGIPLVATYLTHRLGRLLDPQMPDYLTLTYAYLPLTLAGNLAYYLPSAITEAGEILPVVARTFGHSGAGLPSLTWSLDVAQFLQGATLLTAIAFSIYPLLKISRRPLASNLPHLLLMAGFTAVFYRLMF